MAGEVTDKYNRQAGAGSKQSVDVHAGRQPIQFLFRRQNSNRQVNQTIQLIIYLLLYQDIGLSPANIIVTVIRSQGQVETSNKGYYYLFLILCFCFYRVQRHTTY